MTKVYDATNTASFTPTYSFTGFASGDTSATLSNTTLQYATSGNVATSHVVGSDRVLANGLAVTGITGSNGSLATDYSVNGTANSGAASASITAAALTASLTNTGVTKVYDATNTASFTPTYSFTGFASGDTSATLSNTTLQYATSGNVATSHVVGSDRVLANGLAVTGITGSNGSLATDYSVNGTANSGAASASITAAALTASLTNTGVTKVYDATNAASFTPTYSFTGFASGDTSATLSNTTLQYATSGNVATSHVVGSDRVLANGLAVTGITGSNGSLATDYSVNGTANSGAASASITAAALTASLTNTGVTKVYDATNTASFTPTYSFTGFASGDTSATLSNTTLQYATSGNVATSHVVGSDRVLANGLAVTGITGSNGSLATDYSVNGTANSGAASASITAAALTASLTNTGVTKVYDATNTASFTPTYSFTGFASGDTSATLSNTTLQYATSGNVATSHVVGSDRVLANGLAVTGITGSNGSLATDYSVNGTANSGAASASITAAALTASLTNTGVTKVYDATNTASFTPTYSFTGFASGDTSATLSNTTLQYATSGNVATSHVVGSDRVLANGLAVTGITGSNGSLATDYSVNGTANSGAASASITAAALTASLTNTGVTKVYDATNTASFTPTYSFTGFASGDTSATLSNTTLQYATSGNVATSHVVGSDRVLANGLAVTGITGSNGSLATDYSVNGTANSGAASASITAAALTASLTNTGVTKVYDATNTASFTPTYSFTGFASGDTSATLSNTTLQYATSGNVATSHVVGSDRVLANGLAVTGITGSNGSLATDYSVNGTANSGAASASITAAALTASLTNTGVTKVYDATNTASFTPTYSFTGFASGDTSATLSNTTLQYATSGNVATSHVVGRTGCWQTAWRSPASPAATAAWRRTTR